MKESFDQSQYENKENPTELSAERIKHVREFAEAARDLGLSPRELLKDKIKKEGTSKEYQDASAIGKFFVETFEKLVEKRSDYGMPRVQEEFMYNAVIGRALIKERCIKVEDDEIGRKKAEEGLMIKYGELGKKIAIRDAALYLESQVNPDIITDPEKYSRVFKEAEAKFFAENILDDKDIGEMTAWLKDIGNRVTFVREENEKEIKK